MRRWIVRALVGALLLLVAAELFARFYLGLGDPPLSIADPDIEYLFKSSQEVKRFGNRIHYNAYSMRSDDFPKHKTDPSELRVMMFGDSVVNGGAQTDQAQIATSILQEQLQAKLNRPVIFGNISAGSWGPVNMLAYARKFGLFDADVVVIVLSSHDYGDVPTIPFTPVVGVQREYPDRKPLLALEEGFFRYFLPRIRKPGPDASVPKSEEPEPQEVQRGLKAIRELIELARMSGAVVIVVQYPEPKELSGPPRPGHYLIQVAAREAGAKVVQLSPRFRAAIAAAHNPYRDSIHPNATGQMLMAEELVDDLIKVLSGSVKMEPATKEALDSRGSGG